MTKIVLASRNKNKIKEIETLLAPLSSNGIKILSLDDIGFPYDIEETGISFEENALIKAKAVAMLGYIGIADDSGLIVDALGGAPGIYSARFSGDGATTESNNMKLLESLSEVEHPMRTARFVSVIACVFPCEDQSFTVRESCEGVILNDFRGDNGFGYDPLFYYEPFGKTFAEMIPSEKNIVSHRGRAMRAFAEIFTSKFGRFLSE